MINLPLTLKGHDPQKDDYYARESKLTDRLWEAEQDFNKMREFANMWTSRVTEQTDYLEIPPRPRIWIEQKLYEKLMSSKLTTEDGEPVKVIQALVDDVDDFFSSQYLGYSHEAITTWETDDGEEISYKILEYKTGILVRLLDKEEGIDE